MDWNASDQIRMLRPRVNEPTKHKEMSGGYGGHLRPYLWVACDPTPPKPKTGSLATLPLFTAPATQNYTWSLATLPTTTRENPAQSLATLPTQIGRVTSDHEPHTLHTFAFVRPYLTSFYQNFPSPFAAHAFNYIPF